MKCIIMGLKKIFFQLWLYEQKNKTKKDFDFWFRSDHSTTTSLGRSNVLFDNDVVVVFQLMTEKKDQLMIINPPL